MVVSAPQPNVLKPATAIIRKIVISSKTFEKNEQIKGKGKEREHPNTASEAYGFERVWDRLRLVKIGDGIHGVLETLRIISKRLEGTGDLELVAQRQASVLAPG